MFPGFNRIDCLTGNANLLAQIGLRIVRIKVLFGKVSEYRIETFSSLRKYCSPEISGMERNRKRRLVKGSRNAGAISQAT